MDNRAFPPRLHASGGRTFRLRVEESSDAADYAKYDRLRNEVWGFPQDHMAGTRNLMCENYLHDGSSLFLAAYEAGPDGTLPETDDRLAGFSYGFVGIRDKAVGFRSPDNLWFYAQYTAVQPAFQGSGLGIAIKEYQRDVLRAAFGLRHVVCTYDPLTGVNAYRNIHHFGMSVLEYRTATYGEYGGRLNRLDVPSDRFFMDWDLEAPPPCPAYDLADCLEGTTPVLKADRRIVIGRSGPLELEVVGEAVPGAAEELALVRIPRDFYHMLRETDVDDPGVRRIPLAWRLAAREAFRALFDRGYRIIDIRAVRRPEAESWYVLRKA
jgi:predicted GNAT superfamily acetyltransferase